MDHVFDVFLRLGFERTFGLHYDDFGIDFGVTFGTFAPLASRNLPDAAWGSPAQPLEMVSEMQCEAPTLAQWPRLQKLNNSRKLFDFEPWNRIHRLQSSRTLSLR